EFGKQGEGPFVVVGGLEGAGKLVLHPRFVGDRRHGLLAGRNRLLCPVLKFTERHARKLARPGRVVPVSRQLIAGVALSELECVELTIWRWGRSGERGGRGGWFRPLRMLQAEAVTL